MKRDADRRHTDDDDGGDDGGDDHVVTDQRDMTSVVMYIFHITHTCTMHTHALGSVAQLAERRSFAGELTLSCARPAADG